MYRTWAVLNSPPKARNGLRCHCDNHGNHYDFLQQATAAADSQQDTLSRLAQTSSQHFNPKPKLGIFAGASDFYDTSCCIAQSISSSPDP